MDKMKVSETLETAIVSMFEEIQSDPNLPEHFSYEFDRALSEIEHKSYDGFIPFTNGGYDLTLLTDLSVCEGSGRFPTHCEEYLREVIETAQNDVLQWFIEDHKEELEKHFTEQEIENDDIHYHSLYEKDLGDLAEMLSEMKRESLEDCFAMQCRAIYYCADNHRNRTGEDEIYFLAGINTDFQYIRDYGLNVGYEETVKVSELTLDKIEQIKDKMLELF